VDQVNDLDLNKEKDCTDEASIQNLSSGSFQVELLPQNDSVEEMVSTHLHNLFLFMLNVNKAIV
jgi:hypothetical protein